MPVIAYHVLHLIWVFRLGPIEFLGTAEQLEVQVMETRKTKLGEDHPDTLTSMANLAFTWKSSGHDAKAVN
ncbi:hypothetical protein N7448_008867 [Penicillium atrosanguineum]|nr:hypothetical protein N7448_008867 [Penicillium atrosanguineum]